MKQAPRHEDVWENEKDKSAFSAVALDGIASLSDRFT
jgi:hypothetical protein